MGGYARPMPQSWLDRQKAEVAKRVAQADVVITTALIPGRAAPVLVTQEMVESMKPGSVIVDLAAAQGGNCPLTQPGQTVVHHGVTLVGQTNLPALVADASALYARNVLDFLKPIINPEGALHLNRDDDIVVACLVAHEGAVTRRHPVLPATLERLSCALRRNPFVPAIAALLSLVAARQRSRTSYGRAVPSCSCPRAPGSLWAATPSSLDVRPYDTAHDLPMQTRAVALRGRARSRGGSGGADQCQQPPARHHAVDPRPACRKRACRWKTRRAAVRCASTACAYKRSAGTDGYLASARPALAQWLTQQQAVPANPVLPRLVPLLHPRGGDVSVDVLADRRLLRPTVRNNEEFCVRLSRAGMDGAARPSGPPEHHHAGRPFRRAPVSPGLARVAVNWGLVYRSPFRRSVEMESVSPTLINLIIFVLAIYVGYHVVWNVTPALHTPLMAVTNAISAIVIVGAMLAAALTETALGKTMGTLAVALAAVNVFGGFLVTRRMLEMFKKKAPKAAKAEEH